jgi:tRNA threonylcarbamoyl adenosine modification protein YeaZ
VLLLAFDTATPAVTAALYDTAAAGPPGADSGAVLAEESRIDPRRHGELLLPAVDRVLSAAGVRKEDLGAIAVGIGPGPYTGLRVGLVTGTALGSALGLPVHGVCTLDGIARAACADGLTGPFAVATDARRKEVYWARYEAGGERATEPAVDRPAEIAGRLSGYPVAGAGALLYPDAFPDARTPEHVSAGALAGAAAERLARGDELPPPLPLYLRRPDAQVPANYKTVLPA